jgi:hypothetical protein
MDGVVMHGEIPKLARDGGGVPMCCGLPPLCVDLCANRSSETLVHAYKDLTLVGSNLSVVVGSMTTIKKFALRI